MEYKIFKNRLGELLVQQALLTTQVMSALNQFSKSNADYRKQSDLIDAVDHLAEDMNVNQNAFSLAVAIFLNTKNYLIEEMETVIDEIPALGVDLFIDINQCIQVLGCGTESALFFIKGKQNDLA